MSAYTQTDYEAIEAAVQESPRGRWFLAEFTRRNRAADTLMLLEAIRKLERGMAENSPHQVSDELATALQCLSEVIGSTLAGIMHTQDESGAAAALPHDAADDVLIRQVRNALEQLSLVKRQIDGLLADRSHGEPAGGSALTAENLQFFKGDEDLFKAAPEPPASPSPPFVVVGEEQGAAPQAPKQPLHADPGAAPPASAPKGDPNERIVFIRRATSGETSIPLADEADERVPASQSQPKS